LEIGNLKQPHVHYSKNRTLPSVAFATTACDLNDHVRHLEQRLIVIFVWPDYWKRLWQSPSYDIYEYQKWQFWDSNPNVY